MNKEIREQLEQDTMDYLAELSFVRIDKCLDVSPADEEVLNSWISEYNHLLREKYFHQYWSKVLFSERSYRAAKEYREYAEDCHQASNGMYTALGCMGYTIIIDKWIVGDGRFKNTDFPTWAIINKDIPF